MNPEVDRHSVECPVCHNSIGNVTRRRLRRWSSMSLREMHGRALPSHVMEVSL